MMVSYRKMNIAFLSSDEAIVSEVKLQVLEFFKDTVNFYSFTTKKELSKKLC